MVSDKTVGVLSSLDPSVVDSLGTCPLQTGRSPRDEPPVSERLETVQSPYYCPGSLDSIPKSRRESIDTRKVFGKLKGPEVEGGYIIFITGFGVNRNVVGFFSGPHLSRLGLPKKI